jgi:hypothetical protein
MRAADLERLVAEELKALPSPRAPRTLLPRVMAAVGAWASRPWYTRTWFTWPVAWQVASVSLLALLVAGGLTLMPSADAAAGEVVSHLLPTAPGDLSIAASRADAALNAGRVVWRALLEPLAVYAFSLVALMAVACAAVGTALNRIAFRRI